MVVLNDRLAVYIDKVTVSENRFEDSDDEKCSGVQNRFFSWSLQVRSLEQQNKLLEAEIKAYQDRFEKPTGLRLLYEEQLRELKKVAEQMKVQRVRQNPASHRISGAQ